MQHAEQPPPSTEGISDCQTTTCKSLYNRPPNSGTNLEASRLPAYAKRRPKPSDEAIDDAKHRITKQHTKSSSHQHSGTADVGGTAVVTPTKIWSRKRTLPFKRRSTEKKKKNSCLQQELYRCCLCNDDFTHLYFTCTDCGNNFYNSCNQKGKINVPVTCTLCFQTACDAAMPASQSIKPHLICPLAIQK